MKVEKKVIEKVKKFNYLRCFKNKRKSENANKRQSEKSNDGNETDLEK